MSSATRHSKGARGYAALVENRCESWGGAHGSDGARIAAATHIAAVDRIEAIVREENIDCDFEHVDGYWFAARPAANIGRR